MCTSETWTSCWHFKISKYTDSHKKSGYFPVSCLCTGCCGRLVDVRPLRTSSQFPIAFQVLWKQARLAFKAKYFLSLFLVCMSYKLGCQRRGSKWYSGRSLGLSSLQIVGHHVNGWINGEIVLASPTNFVMDFFLFAWCVGVSQSPPPRGNCSVWSSLYVGRSVFRILLHHHLELEFLKTTLNWLF